jgi:predicted nuclease of predicted toxin-antitoxin system
MMAGRACIRGMRITVATIVGRIAGGASNEEILATIRRWSRKTSGKRWHTPLTSRASRWYWPEPGMRFTGLAVRVAEWLRHEGHDAGHLDEAGLQRMSDHEIFALAAREHRIIITTDLDFGEILAHSRQASTSVIVFQLAWPRTVRIIERLATVLGAAGPALQQGAIVLVEETRYRVRRLPIGSSP